MLDLGFVRREVAGFYGSNGHVSIDPVIIIKLMPLLPSHLRRLKKPPMMVSDS